MYQLSYFSQKWERSVLRVSKRYCIALFMLLSVCFLNNGLFAQNSSTPGGKPVVVTPSTSGGIIQPQEDGSASLSEHVPPFKSFKEGEEISFSGFQNYFRETFALRNDDGLKVKKQESDDLGFTHYRFQQWYHNFPVEFGDYLVHVKNGQVTSMNGNFISEIQAPIKPLMLSATALNTALGYVDAEKYLWEDSNEEANLQKATDNPNATHYPSGQLVILPGDTDPVQASLVWKFDIFTINDEGSKTVYVDATTGKVLHGIPLTHNCNVGSGNTTWHGNNSFITDYTGSTYRLYDDCNSDIILTRDWNGGGTATDYNDLNNSWTAASQNARVSSHFYTRRSKQYFKNTFGRNSFDNAYGDIYVYNNATFGSSNSNNNASFATYTGYGRMKVGGGNTSSATDDWNAVDIIGHELAHGVTRSSAGLVYQKESGALNESFSDIFGVAIERYVETYAPGTYTLDWLMGEDRGAIRSLSNPNAYGDPDTYDGTNYVATTTCTPASTNDYCGVHTNSGVQNFWFYLLVSGGSGTNDNSDAYAVSGLGWTKAAAIAYRNLTVYLTSSSTFMDARNGSIQAAADLYGNGSNEMTQVANAWHAVGVGIVGGPNLDQFSSTRTVTGTNVTVSVNIENNGTQTAGYSYVGYYLSANTTITTGDYRIGTDYVPALAPGASSAESISIDVSTVNPPIPAGTYYIGFLIDYTGRVAESNEGDNRWVWTTGTVTIPSGSPNLTKLTDNGSRSGTTVTMNPTVTNNGARGAGSSSIGYYLSTNTIISTGDYRIGTDYVPALSVGASSAETFSIDVTTVTPSIPPGTYYMGYLIDYGGAVSESNESDNDWRWTNFTVIVPVGSPNLDKVTDNLTLSGTNISTSTTIENNGVVGAGYSYVGYYLSTNTTISTGDILLGTDYVSSLSVGASSAESFSIDVTTNPNVVPGTYYFGYIIDYQNAVTESNESDNTWAWGSNPIVVPGPNLTRSGSSLSKSGTTLTINTTVVNNGVSAAGASSTLNYYLSTNTIISTFDYQIGTDFIPNLGVGGSSVENITVDVLSVTPFIPPGTYYIGYIIDDGNVIAESNEGDNIFNFVTQVVIPAVPNLTRSTDNLVVTGTSLNISATATNNGTGPSGNSTLGYYLSTNTIISTLDYRIGSDAVAGLAVGATGVETLNIDVLNVQPAIPPGTYNVGYIWDVNASVNELNENDNNFFFSGQTVVIPDLPNLTKFSDTLLVTGTNVSISARVTNDGTLAAGASTMKYYLSTNNYISTADYEIGSDVVGALAIGGISTETLAIDVTTVAPAIPPGTYYVGYLLDVNGNVTENNESDNRYVFTYARVTITPPPMLPNLTYQMDSVVISGTNLTIGAEMNNNGVAASTATAVAFYLSTNPTISTGDYLLGTRPIPALGSGALFNTLLSVDVTTVVPAIPPGNYYIGYLIDYQGLVSESSESDNDRVFTAPQMTVPNPPSPTITITSPTSATTWVSATTETVTWNSTLINPTDTVVIRFYNGSNWSTLDPGTVNDGSENITVPIVASTVVNAAIRIYLKGTPAVEDYSSLFTVDPIPLNFIQLLGDHVTGVSGDTIRVPIRVKDFLDVISVQGSFHLDSLSIGTVIGVGNYGIPSMNAGHFTVNGVTNTVTMAWTQPAVLPVNLLDDAILFSIAIELTGTAGDSSDVSMDSNPTTLLAGFYNGGNPVQGNVVTSYGSVKIGVSGSISGRIVNTSGAGINNVTVNLAGAVTDVDYSNANGDFDFASLPLNNNYLVTPSKNVSPTNGVNTLDIVFVRLHILGSTTLNSPYKIIAADADGSNSVNTLDIVRIRQVILGSIPGFPNGVPSWRFIPRDHVFPNPVIPFGVSFPESRIYTPLSGNEVLQDFIGLKVGDVNNSASTARKAYAGQTALFVEETSFKAGETQEIVVKMKHAQQFVGMQFALEFDPETFELMEVQAETIPGLTSSSFGFHTLDKGILNFSWDNPGSEDFAFEAGTELFRLKLKAKRKLSSLNGNLSISEDAMSPEAYRGLEDLWQPVLQVERLGGETVGFDLFQNYPNPAKGQTVIGFTSPLNQELTLRLMDMKGRILKVETIDARAGYQNVNWQLQDLASGVYVYQLCGESGCLSKRLTISQ